VAISARTKVTKGLRKLCFTTVDRCPHGELDENAAPAISVDSASIQTLVEILTKTAFLSDLDRVNCASATSAVESLHSLLLRYCPKRKYYAKAGYELKAMLGVLDWNITQRAELEGVRKTVGYYRSYSKARGEARMITRKATVEQPWKGELVERAMERKRQFGPGTPDLADEELEGEIDDLASSRSYYSTMKMMRWREGRTAASTSLVTMTSQWNKVGGIKFEKNSRVAG